LILLQDRGGGGKAALFGARDQDARVVPIPKSELIPPRYRDLQYSFFTV
jgi:hypothetical protein